MITVRNNEINIQVRPGVFFPFRNATAYLADGHQRSVAFQKGDWDGYKYIVTHDGMCLGGHLNTVISYFNNEEVVDKRTIPSEINNWESYCPNLLGRYVLTDFQKNAFKAMCPKLNNLVFPRGILDVATNGGKSLVMAAAVKALQQIKPNVKILFLFLQVELLEQLSDLFKELNIEHDYLMSEAIMHKRKIKNNYDDIKILLAMNRSLYEKMADIGLYVEAFDVVMVDECHLATAPQINQILTTCSAWGRWGFSGTPFEGKSEEQYNTLIGQFGQTLLKVSNKELIEAGISAKPSIYSVTYDFMGRFISYQDGLKALIVSLERNLIAYKWIKRDVTKKYLVVVEHIAHLEILEELLKSFNPTILHGQLGSKKRTENLEAFKSGNRNVIITNGVAKHGLNIKDINCIIYLRAGKSPVWLNQIIGRGLRLKSEGKQEFEVVDPYDNVHIFRDQADARLTIYADQGYSVEQIKFTVI